MFLFSPKTEFSMTGVKQISILYRYYIGESEAKKGYEFGWLFQLGKEVEMPFTINNSSGTDIWVGGPGPSMSYATALYYTLSCMTSVGFGNVSSTSEMEKIFTSCMMILGCKCSSYTQGCETIP